MRKARSRNFILIVCGVLLMLLLGFVIAKTIIDVIDEVSNKNTIEELQKNIFSSSSKIKLNGKGNFIDSTPKLEKTTISDFNVRLGELDDEVYYSLTFCNMNDVDVKFNKLVVEGISCTDSLGNNGCNNVFVDRYVQKKNKLLKAGDVIAANSCVDVVIDTKYIAYEAVDTEVIISKVVFELEDIKG